MNKKRKYKEPEIYSTTGFKDVLASPLFYSIAVITFVLGVSSIFGFLQNPLKLKAVVSAINHKISSDSLIKSPATQNVFSLSENFYGLLQKDANENLKHPSEKMKFELYQDRVEENARNNSFEKDLHRVAFNYDITSNNFWSDLDSTSIESAIEESDRLEQEASIIGIPLESDFQYKPNRLNDSIYALKI
jgi:hypothetical protein